ncbi:MAG: hypothetical protein V4565_00320 [Bacteroidota bacterium]
MLKNIQNHLLFLITLFVSASLLLYFAYHNEICEGGPDNVWHYYFSKYALQYPDFFLHHWGKPLFILLSTGFAQFGFFGIKVFNVMCGLASAVVVYKILIHLNIRYAWISAALLLFSPIYFITLQSALTEPLFSLMLITAVYLYLTDKLTLATCLLSFLIFSRSEGMFIIICFAAYLVIIKQWMRLPLLLMGFVIYAIVGYLMGHDFLWYFTENPYQYESPYGHGHYTDILKRYESIWGLSFLIVLCIASIFLLYKFFIQKQYMFWKPINETSKIMYLVFIPSAIFLGFHLYVWHNGLCGSAGLERVLASVIPCYVVLTFWAFDKLVFSRFPKFLSILLIGSFFYYHVQTPFKVLSYPLKAWGGDKCELDAAVWFKTIMPKQCVIYYAYPNIVLHLDRDPFDKNLNREQMQFHKDCSGESSLPTFFFWDSMFSEFSFGVKPIDVENCNYKKIQEFTDGGDFRLIVYEKIK